MLLGIYGLLFREADELHFFRENADFCFIISHSCYSRPSTKIIGKGALHARRKECQTYEGTNQFVLLFGT